MQRCRSSLGAALAALLPWASLAQVHTAPIEPNGTKATATRVVRPMVPGDTIGGVRQGADYFLVETAPMPAGIYEHRLTSATGTPGVSLRGVQVAGGGVVPGSDRPVQSLTADVNEPTFSINWYGFGAGEQVYVLNEGGPTEYTLVYSRSVVTPQALSSLASPGVTTWQPSAPAQAGLVAFDSQFRQVSGATGQVTLSREGTHYLACGAVGTWGSVITSRPSGPVAMDFPGVVAAGFDVGDSFRAIDLQVAGDGYPAASTDRVWQRRGRIGWALASPPAGCAEGWVDRGAPGPRKSAALAHDANRGVTVLLGGDRTTIGPTETWERSEAGWRNRGLVSPAPRGPGAMTFDAARGRLLAASLETVTGSGLALWALDDAGWSLINEERGLGARSGLAMAYDSARQEVVLFGGAGTVNGVTDLATWIWDGVSWSRRDVPGPTNRFGHAMAYDPIRQRVVLFGGRATTSSAPDSQTWLWDGAGWSQISAAGPSARHGHSMTFDPAVGRIVMMGGANEPIDAVWEFDGTNWTRAADPPFPTRWLRFAVSTLESAAGRIVVAGVQDGGFQEFGSSQTWARTGGAWALLDEAPSGRTQHAMAFDSTRGETVLYGGRAITSLTQGASGATISVADRADTWTFDGYRWSRRESSSAPGSRQGHSLTFDPVRGTTVLFGGGRFPGPTALGDTWVWNGETWARAATTGPSPRVDHATGWDPVSQRVILFGGAESSRGFGLSDTWAWDGSTWTLLASGGPPGRYGASMATDTARQRLVMFGGASSLSTNLNDTWEWDGSQWLLAAPASTDWSSPSPRAFHRLAYDALAQRVVLVGGGIQTVNSLNPLGASVDSSGTFYQALWEWNGTAWSPRLDVALPAPPRFGAMTYDTARDRLLWFGGWSPAGIGSRLLSLRQNDPAISQHPSNTVVRARGVARLFVSPADGRTFQWRRERFNISDGPTVRGSQSAVLIIDPVGPGNSGSYDVLVTDECGTSTSLPATLTVRCFADFDLDGYVTPDDLSGFIAAYFADPPSDETDVDRSGFIDPDDLADFIAGYFGGCF